MASKEAFLQKLADKIGRERVYEAPRPRWDTQPWDHLHKELDQAGLVAQFADELMKLGGVVIPVANGELLPKAVNAYLTEAEFKRLILWPAGEDLDGAEPADVFEEQGYEVTRWSAAGDRDALVRAAEAAHAGLVYASHGLSETGSVVLYNRGDRGRVVSLLPNQLLVVVRGSTIVPRITQVLAGMPGKALDYSCVNIITGPSRTSDIEMDLTIGVHGPGRIAVFLIEDHLAVDLP